MIKMNKNIQKQIDNITYGVECFVANQKNIFIAERYFNSKFPYKNL